MDGIGLAGGENGGDEGAAFGREELNGEEEDNGEEEEAERAKELGNSFSDGFALIAEKERDQYNSGYYHCEEDAVGCTASSFFEHIWIRSRRLRQRLEEVGNWEMGRTVELGYLFVRFVKCALKIADSDAFVYEY